MHDKNGKPIHKGDLVLIEGRVIDQSASGDGSFCSIQVEIDGDWDGKGGKGTNWFSAKQVQVVEEVSPEEQQLVVV